MHGHPVLTVAGGALAAYAVSFVVIYAGVCAFMEDTAPLCLAMRRSGDMPPLARHVIAPSRGPNYCS